MSVQIVKNVPSIHRPLRHAGLLGIDPEGLPLHFDDIELNGILPAAVLVDGDGHFQFILSVQLFGDLPGRSHQDSKAVAGEFCVRGRIDPGQLLDIRQLHGHHFFQVPERIPVIGHPVHLPAVFRQGRMQPRDAEGHPRFAWIPIVHARLDSPHTVRIWGHQSRIPIPGVCIVGIAIIHVQL